MKISYILIANGLEFTDKFVTKDKQTTTSGNHKFDKPYSLGEIKDCLTKLTTPKTNDMVERTNGTIKNIIVKVTIYQTIGEMKRNLAKFLLFYHFTYSYRELRKEVKVRTLYVALKYWYNLKPNLFIGEVDMFREMVFEKENDVVKLDTYHFKNNILCL